MKLRVALLGLILGAFAAHSAPSPSPSWEEYLHYCREHRQAQSGQRVAKPKIGKIQYIPLGAIQASQSRFSFDRLQETLNKTIYEEEGAYRKKKKWRFAHDKGQSPFAPDQHGYGIFYRGQVYLNDGHHHTLISLYLGAKTMPITIVADWSDLGEKEFLSRMESHRFSYLHDAWGRPAGPLDLCDMVDDPNLFLARRIIRRVEAGFDYGRFTIYKSRGADVPIAIKVNGDIPFYEFEIADALRRAGVYVDGKYKPSKADLKKYSRILRAERELNNSRLKDMLLLKKPTALDKLDLKMLILEHLARKSCEQELLLKESAP